MSNIDTTQIHDRTFLTELLNKIKFLRNRVPEFQLVFDIEKKLSTRFEFQVTFNKRGKMTNWWDYYIRCSIKYPNLPRPIYSNRLDTLTANIRFLLKEGTY